MMRKKMVLILVLCMMLLCSTGLIYADQPTGEVTWSSVEDCSGTLAIIPGATGSLVRMADKQGLVTISCTCDEFADVITAELQVQRMDTETGKYYNYTTSPYYRYAYNTANLLSEHTITVQHTGIYRVKVSFEADFGSSIYRAGPAYTQAVAL